MEARFLKPQNWGGVDYRKDRTGDLPETLVEIWTAQGIVEPIVVLPEPEAVEELPPVGEFEPVAEPQPEAPAEETPAKRK